MISNSNERGITISIENYDLIPFSMLFLGSIALILSVLSSSYISAFIGMALTFWGALFFYIKPKKYVKLELLEAASISALTNMEKILIEAKANSKGVYLPPGHLQDPASSLIFVSTKANQLLPTIEESSLGKLKSKNPSGLFITPPGLELSKLFEKQLKHTFTETSLVDLQKDLPRLFDDLQITKNLSIQAENNTISVAIGNHVFKDLCEETAKLELTHRTIGCALSSAFACAFAKATGKPVAIETEETSQDGKTLIQYRVLED